MMKTALNRDFISSARHRGFTLVELMVVVAILGLLAALAAPSFLPTIERWRVRSAAESVVHSLYFARSEAIKLGGNVVVERKASSGNCTSLGVTDFSCGFTIYRDVDGDNTQDACDNTTSVNECTIRDVDISNSVRFTIPNSVGYLNIDRWGVIANNGVTTGITTELTAKGRSLTDPSGAKVCIPSSGRISRIRGAESC